MILQVNLIFFKKIGIFKTEKKNSETRKNNDNLRYCYSVKTTHKSRKKLGQYRPAIADW